jgi:hypothetical protein
MLQEAKAMAYGRLLRELRRYVLLVVAVCSCAPLLAQVGVPEQVSSQKLTVPPPAIAAFLPAKAVLVKQLTVDFDNDGGPASIVLASTIRSEQDPYSYEIGVRVLQYIPVSGWTVAFADSDSVASGGGDAIDIEKIRSSNGKEGVVVILKYSGAGTATDWHVLARVKRKFVKLNPAPVRDKALKTRGEEFMGYNDVSAKDDLVIEELPGYSRGRARCCPDKPSIEVRQKFTGTSIKVDSVKQLPFTPPGD